VLRFAGTREPEIRLAHFQGKYFAEHTAASCAEEETFHARPGRFGRWTNWIRSPD
jgi:hypothetical protein